MEFLERGFLPERLLVAQGESTDLIPRDPNCYHQAQSLLHFQLREQVEGLVDSEDPHGFVLD